MPLKDKVTSQGPGVCLAGNCILIAFGDISSPQISIDPKITCKPSKKFSPTTVTVTPPVRGPSHGLNALIIGVDKTDELELVLPDEDDDDEDDVFDDVDGNPDDSSGSGRRVRLPCLELLCTNMLSDIANR